MNLLESLDILMAENKINKHILSQKTGIAYSTLITMYANGGRDVKLSTLLKLCEFFNCSLDYLVRKRLPNTNDILVQSYDQAEAKIQKAINVLLDIELKEEP